MLTLLKKLRFRHLFWGFFYFFIFCLLLRSSFNYLDTDLGWHLKVGQEIINSGSVPHLNYYNYTYTGSWVDHEWLSNILLYLTYSHFGYIAVSVGFALLIVAVLIILNITVYRRNSRPGVFVIALFQGIGLVVSLPHLGVRVQEVGLLFLLMVLLIIDYYERRSNWLILLFLPPLMYLWTCLHASFLIGFFILGAWAAIKISEIVLARFWPRPWLDFSKILSFRKIFIFITVTAASLVATFFTPYWLKLYFFLENTTYKSTFYQSHIQEWLSQFSFPFQYGQLVYLVLVVLALIAYIYHTFSKDKYFKINLWTLFLVILFVVLSFKSRRHFPLMFVATFIFLTEIYTTIFSNAITGKKWRLDRWLKACLLICLFLVSASQLIQTKFTADPFVSFCSDYPCGAVTFLRDHPDYDSWRLFNDYGWGGFLIWTDPSRLLFIDGRLPQVTFNGHSFLEEYLDFFKKDADFSQKLNQYQIKLVLLPAQDKKLTASAWEKIWLGLTNKDLQNINYLRVYLSSSSDWQPVYSDRTAIIFGKKAK